MIIIIACTLKIINISYIIIRAYYISNMDSNQL